MGRSTERRDGICRLWSTRKPCIQCGLCPAVCPDVFTLDPGEPARAISGPVPEECRLAAQEAADSCPVGAIEVR